MKTTLRSLLSSIAVLAFSANAAHAGSFTEALEATYKNNPRIKAERERQKATDEGVSQALSGLRPNISAGYTNGGQSTAFGNAGETESHHDTKTLTVVEPLFRGGRTLAEYNASQQRVKAGQFALSAVEQQVLLDAVTAYMDVVSARAILDLSQNNQEVLEKQLTAAKERFDVGEVTRTDVAQSEARLSQAKTQVISAEGQRAISSAAFERVVGFKPETKLPVPTVFPELPATLEEARERARVTNPELLSAIHQAKSAHYDVNADIATLLPQVDLVGSMSRQTGAGTTGDSDYDQDSLSVRVTIPLYQTGAEYSRVRQSENVARQRKHQSLDAGQATEERVTQAWEQLETSVATINARQDQIKAADVALSGVRQEQEYGARTVLDVLDAEQELFFARTNFVRAQRDRVVAAYNLALNLGLLTPTVLDLDVKQYDPTEHYNDIKWLPAGF